MNDFCPLQDSSACQYPERKGVCGVCQFDFETLDPDEGMFRLRKMNAESIFAQDQKIVAELRANLAQRIQMLNADAAELDDTKTIGQATFEDMARAALKREADLLVERQARETQETLSDEEFFAKVPAYADNVVEAMQKPLSDAAKAKSRADLELRQRLHDQFMARLRRDS